MHEGKGMATVECREWEIHRGDILDSKNGFDVIDCEACQFKHVVPIPTSEELNAFYEQKFYETKSEYFQQHREQLEWWNFVNGERYERLEGLLSGKPGTILDIGSGPGFFLQLGKERGWEVLGLEPGSQAVEHARNLGVKVIQGSWCQIKPEQLGLFDVVHVGWAMEHLPDPKAFVKACSRLVKPGGFLCTVVANDYNPLQQILHDHFEYEPWWVVPPEHINYFDIASLKQLFESSGFECVNVTTSFPLELFLLMGENYVGDPKVGRQCHNRRKSLELSLAQSQTPELKKQLYKAFSNLGLGRDIEMIVQRSNISTRSEEKRR